MRIFELKRRLANILEVPEDPVRLVGRLLLNKEELAGQGSSHKMLAILARAFSLECLWEEFKEVLEREGKDLNVELSHKEVEILSDLTEQFFADVEISRVGRISYEEIQTDKNLLLEAIGVVKSSLYIR